MDSNKRFAEAGEYQIDRCIGHYGGGQTMLTIRKYETIM